MSPTDSALSVVVGYIDVPCKFLDPDMAPQNIRVRILSSGEALKFLEVADLEEQAILFCSKTDLADGWIQKLHPDSHEDLVNALDQNFKTAEARVKRELKKVSRLGPLAKESNSARGSLG